MLHAPAAFIGSLSQILSHLPAPSMHLSTTIPALAEAAGMSDWSSIDVPLHQKTLPGSIDQASFLMFIDSAPNSHFKALALSSAIRHAGDWLNVIPCTSLSLHFFDKEFQFTLCYWLGLQMFEEGCSCPVCNSPADIFGDHQVGCGGNVIGPSDTMLFRKLFSLWHSLLPLCPERRSLAPSFVLTLFSGKQRG